MSRISLILTWMSRISLILAWMTVGIWVAATIRVALSPDADLTPIALTFTVALVAVAYKITQDYERGRDHDAIR